MQKIRSKILRWLLYGVGALFIGLAAFFGNNNFSCWPTTTRDLQQNMDDALTASTNWLTAHTEEIAVTAPNTALLHMLADMVACSGDVRLQQILTIYLRRPNASIWQRMVIPDAPVTPLAEADFARYEDYQRWILYALAPEHIQLTADDHASRIDPARHHWGSLTHQLFALYIERRQHGASPAFNTLLDRLCERIAFEALWDVRVTDLYLQRVAFLLAAGRPDLVKRRWVERILSHQQSDGGWLAAWHGWGPSLGMFRWQPLTPNQHTTMQGIWALVMLKYRYPAWLTN